ncbi:carboxymuconolactone decarboxylase family protein [Paenibacillus sp. J5C_2022]|uniref:carboxymuconolactone decarboxylase family protein n=1 Tax=Paenibacillus sp. J5C2022 TaxID=2977129 RepID=UPI0021D2FA23|nr:carboxymuconolactone decarboxylase family protein [Paenibacillus sp. J5C2022]MCU6708527.1 carboxymuconolactone decarboxylase family protein [Paenibacillus sp. J5C2022]
MTQRMQMNKVVPKGYTAMLNMENYVQTSGIDKTTLELIKIRASQMNGCAFCIDMHTKDARAYGESERRIYALNAWRETPFFTDKERAALALTEAITLIADNHVPDAVYEEAARHYDQEEIGNLIMATVTINSWNRIAISTGMMPE